MPEQDRSRLFLFVLGVAAVHALCLAAVLPVLFTLPGQDAGIAQNAVKQDAIVRDTIVNVEVLPSSEPAGDSEALGLDQIKTGRGSSPAAGLSLTPDPSELTSALPDIPQNADTAPGEPAALESTAPVAAATSAPDLIGNAGRAPDSSPPPADETATVSAADPASTNAIPREEEAKPATTVSLPVAKPAPVVKPRPTAAKAVKPQMRRQASVTTKTQSRGMFGGFFQSKPRPKTQRAATTTR